MLINLANWCASKGHDVDLVLFNATGPYQSLIAENVTVLNFEKKRSLYSFNALAEYLRTKRPDVLVSALHYVNIIAIVGRIIARSKTKMVISERNHITRSFRSMNSSARFIWRSALRILYPFSDQIIGISNGVCQDLRALLPVRAHSKIVTLYNPVVTNAFDDSLQSVAPDIFPKDSDIKLIASGRLVEQKDYPTMLQAFARIVQGSPKAHLVILGAGVLERELKRLVQTSGVEKNVSFIGFVQNPLAYMKQADIFIITSAWEGFGNVIVEALYCGLKIVATDCPSGPSEILADGKYGALCPVGDVRQVAEAVNRLKTEHVFADTQKERALDFHVDRIGVELIKNLQRII